MNDEIQVKHRPLLQGVIAWCDQTILKKIIELEADFAFIDLQGKPWPQIHPDRLRKPPNLSFRGDYAVKYQLLGKYWQALEDDLILQLRREHLFLEGILVTPEMDQKAQAIDGAFASEFSFILRDESMTYKGKKYVSLILSLVPSPWAPLELRGDRTTRDAHLFKASDLTPDQIVELIEEHARRVVAEPGATLMAPGKVSLIPLIRMKMRDRARRGELDLNLRGEAAWLAAWIASKSMHWDTPKAATIEKTLRQTYAALIGGSNAAT